MLTDEKIKRGLGAWYKLCPLRHALILVSALVIVFHLLTRPLYALNVWLAAHMVRPAHRWLSQQSGRVPFSLAELLIALLALFLLFYLVSQIADLFRKPKFFLRIYRTLTTLLALGLSVYAGFCMLWGVFYYGDDFMAQSGLKNEPISVGQLERVTAWFADLANEYSGRVPRGEDGVCAVDRGAVLDHSPVLYRGVERNFPCLAGPELPVKGVLCSRVMSSVDFTGFFFPFTAEANVNLDFPSALFPSTVAHELAHQRGVAKEQEANFVAVLACLADGDPAYVYSAAMLAYSHLSSALYSADPEACARISGRLNEAVRADLAASRSYWAQYETPVREVSNKVYEGFLFSYNQDLGLKSYGACVDLLVNYYDPLVSGQSPAPASGDSGDGAAEQPADASEPSAEVSSAPGAEAAAEKSSNAEKNP